MANNPRIRDGIGALPEPPILLADKDGRVSKDAVLQVNNILRAIFKRFDAGISLGGANQGAASGNIDGQWINIASTGTANATFTVPHGLGRIPVFVFSMLDRAGDIYSVQYGSWTDSQIYLRCSVSNAEAILLVV